MISILLVAIAHVMPPGDVDRAMQVVVTPDEIRIDYRFGLGEEALLDELMRLDSEIEIPADPVDRARLHMERAAEEIGTRLKVTAGDQQLTVVFDKVDLIYQHHLRAACHYVVDISDIRGRVQVRIEDGNFAAFPGFGQNAAKPRGTFPFFDTNEAPILLRAERFSISTGEKFRPPEIVVQLEREAAEVVVETESTAASDEKVVEETSKDQRRENETAKSKRDSPAGLPKGQQSWTPWLVRGTMVVLLLIAGLLAFRK